jgi:hypothetical protein
MWDSVFVLINHIDRPYKKKDLWYLLNSRLKKPEKENIIISHNIKINNKCLNCKDFRPWILLKNQGEGLFLLKKFIEKFEPWISIGLNENIYEFKKDNADFDFIFALINIINSRKELYDLIRINSDIIIDSDLRLKNECYDCENLFPWILIKKNQKGLEFASIIKKSFSPYIILCKQKTIYKHNIPKFLWRFNRWTKKEEMRYGEVQIEI